MMNKLGLRNPSGGRLSRFCRDRSRKPFGNEKSPRHKAQAFSFYFGAERPTAR